jgi:H-type small acid-soluble spore protein
LKLKRAQKIVLSEDNIEVKLKGNPIWIESLDELNETAKIHLENDPKRSLEVEISQLQE